MHTCLVNAGSFLFLPQKGGLGLGPGPQIILLKARSGCMHSDLSFVGSSFSCRTWLAKHAMLCAPEGEKRYVLDAVIGAGLKSVGRLLSSMNDRAQMKI